MAAALANPVTAAGEPASRRAVSAWPAHQDAALHDLAAAAEALRFGLAANPAATAEALGELERRALSAVVDPADLRSGPRLSWFLRAAILRIGGAAEAAPTVGYYDPFVDAWLLTHWTRLGGRWRLIAARWASGAALRGPEAAAAAWPRDGEPWGEGLVRASRDAARDFDACCDMTGATGRPLPAGDAALADVAQRTDRAEAGLADWVSDPARRTAAEALLTAIRAGRSSSGAGGARMADLPTATRNSLLPVTAVAEPDADALVFASQNAPGVLIVAELGPDRATRRLTIVALTAEGAP